ncbi:MAG: Bug family tripartite tricarboxylate transporter substrate binding protein, partial [Burkholderiaceae bacterium]
MNTRSIRRMPCLLGKLLAAGIVGASMLAGASTAAEYPAKPIVVVSPYSPGNTLDIPVQIFGDFLLEKTGQRVLIDHRPGAAGIVAAQRVANAVGDGYTVLLGPMGVFVTNPHTYAKLPYSADQSFKPVGNFMGAPLVLAVNAGLGVNSVAELVAYGKRHPGKPAYASFGLGNSSHFAGALFNQHAGIDMLHVPFSGTPKQILSLLSGDVMAAFTVHLAVKPHVDSGKLKILATTASERLPQLPDVPTFKELGYPDLEINMWTGLFVPASTPDAVVESLNALVNQALNMQTMRDKVLPNGIYPKPTSISDFKAFIASEYKKWGEAVR